VRVRIGIVGRIKSMGQALLTRCPEAHGGLVSSSLDGSFGTYLWRWCVYWQLLRVLLVVLVPALALFLDSATIN
jgi:hypothetical protein